MAITEQDRIRLYRHFEADMGEELATKMMDSLPPAGWGDVATKQDLEDLRTHDLADIRKDVEHLRESMDQGFAHLRESTAQGFAYQRESTAQGFAYQRESTEHLREFMLERLGTTEWKVKQYVQRELRIQTGAIAGLVVTLGAIVRLF